MIGFLQFLAKNKSNICHRIFYRYVQYLQFGNFSLEWHRLPLKDAIGNVLECNSFINQYKSDNEESRSIETQAFTAGSLRLGFCFVCLILFVMKELLMELTADEILMPIPCVAGFMDNCHFSKQPFRKALAQHYAICCSDS